jgi:hypothetical protein
MATDKHTPAPWNAQFVGESDGGDVYEVHNDRGTQVASSMYESDARLIAAAPELLESLRNCLDNPWPAEADAGRLARWEQAVEQARAAIAKAEGK